MSTAPLYQLQDVATDYGNDFQLCIERLEISAGEMFCLLGPTGAGKSTLLRMLAALTSPDGGEIQFEQQRLAADNLPTAVRHRIVMVHQMPLLLTGTVRRNVEYGLRLRKVKSLAERVDRVLEQLNLTDLASQSAQTLSGGQAQLVALARALVVKPDVLLLDEPTANLDPAHVALVEETIAGEQQQRGTTVVWSTHNLFQAQRLAHRVGLLLDGKLIETAAGKTFFDNPTDPRTKDFIEGKMVY